MISYTAKDVKILVEILTEAGHRSWANQIERFGYPIFPDPVSRYLYLIEFDKLPPYLYKLKDTICTAVVVWRLRIGK